MIGKWKQTLVSFAEWLLEQIVCVVGCCLAAWGIQMDLYKVKMVIEECIAKLINTLKVKN